MHDQRIIVRFDGIYPEIKGDNLAFTFMSHFIGTDGRDYFKSSWIGIASLLKTGVDLDMIQIVGPDTVDVSITDRK